MMPSRFCCGSSKDFEDREQQPIDTCKDHEKHTGNIYRLGGRHS